MNGYHFHLGPLFGTNIYKKDQFMEHNQYSVIMNQLHALMKKQKMSYGRLSNLIKVPESTLKKWFHAKDGSFNRINVICEALQTSLSEVLESIHIQHVRTFVMGKKQQDYFLKDMTAFKVYWLLVYERLSPTDIEKRLRLNTVELRKYFFKLDLLNLIDVNLKEKVLVPKANPIRWNPKGAFMQKIFKNWSGAIVEESLQSKKDSDLILQYFQISEDSEIEFRKDLVALEEKYARRTIQELRSSPQMLKKIRFVAALAQGEFFK